MTTEKPTIFISCGQVTDTEKDLGQTIKEIIDYTSPFQGYFAQNQSSLEGVTRNIFAELDKCFGLICVMHERGMVSVVDGAPTARASVWIEQEIAIAAFLTQVLGRRIRLRVYVKKGINREGVRDQVQVNPMFFDSDVEVLKDLPKTLQGWSQDLSGIKRASFKQPLENLLEELRDNGEILAMDFSNFQPVSEDSFRDLKKSGVFRELELSAQESIKLAYRDIANYNGHLETMRNIQNYGPRANHVGMYVGPAKKQASKSVGNAIGVLERLLQEG